MRTRNVQHGQAPAWEAEGATRTRDIAQRWPIVFPPFSKKKRTDRHVAVRALQHLVHALGPQRGAQDAGHGLAGLDVGLHRVQAGDAGLGVLLLL